MQTSKPSTPALGIEKDGSLVMSGQVIIPVEHCGPDGSSYAERLAIAQRIHACWNACQGIATADLVAANGGAA